MDAIPPKSSPLEDVGPAGDVPLEATAIYAPTTNLPQLDDYIALGCLVVDLPSHELLGRPLLTQPRTLSDHISYFDFPLRDAVNKLIEAKWIRVFSKDVHGQGKCILRIHVLPQDVGRSKFALSSNSRGLHAAFDLLLMHVNTSATIWGGTIDPKSDYWFDISATPEENSLFYIFNTLPSPAPSPNSIAERYSRLAAKEILDTTSGIRGLQTPLYPYQARTAALMLQRESEPELILDPRLEIRECPDDEMFYFGPRDGSLLKHPRLYESVRGGILAETMGLGKTIICLAVVLATKGHLPKIPGHCSESVIVRERTGTLAQMALANANRHSVPAKAYLERLCQGRDEDFNVCLNQVKTCPPKYRLPVNVVRFQRKTELPPPIELTLCSGTIVVVPRNLVHQWELELRKHVENGPNGLRVLVMNNPRTALPPVDVLRHYDVVLFSRQRFEREVADGQDQAGRRTTSGATLACRCPYIGATRKRDCTCLRVDDIYHSPLKQLHWLRLIIDEGHAFTSKASNAVQVANKLVRAERRWIVSGTPARHRLFGVEVEAGSEESQKAQDVLADPDADDADVDVEDLALAPSNDPAGQEQAQSTRRLILRRRKDYHKEVEMKGAAQSLGQLVQHFLKVRPWAASEFDSERADWDEHIFRHEARNKTYSSFSGALRRTLEAIVIKTQPEDVERDIVLPPLQHRTVYLEPCFYDKLTINLFVLVITGNAVTSERTDQDYLFHENSAKARNSLIKNLRESAFFWTGFTTKMVADSIDTGEKYLAKDGCTCSEQDRRTLMQCLDFARLIHDCQSWQALSRTHELGSFVTMWPSDSICSWALEGNEKHLMTGVSHIGEAQSHVNSQLLQLDPFAGLADLGAAVLAQAVVAEEEEQKKQDKEMHDALPAKLTMSTTTTLAETSIAKRHYQASPTKGSTTKKSKAPELQPETGGIAMTTASPTKRKRKASDADRHVVSASSPVRAPTLAGTTSAKLSYLIDQVVRHQADEKLLIFYDGDDIAYYLAQYLDLLHVTHLIYARSLSSEQKAKYIVAFDENPRIRVLIMDVHCGAEGLNVNKASRVYFINPCCRPNIEAQAIKRSHRIGQTRPVHVETLVLKGTVEEAIFKRARLMTDSEHHHAKELADDKPMADIIQNSRSIPMTAEDFSGSEKMAPLAVPQQIFGRDGRGKNKIKGVDVEQPADAEGSKPKRQRKSRAKAKPAIAGDLQTPVTKTPSRITGLTGQVAPSLVSSQQPTLNTKFSLFGG